MLFKIGGRVTSSVRRVVLHLAQNHPWRREWLEAAAACGASVSLPQQTPGCSSGFSGTGGFGLAGLAVPAISPACRFCRGEKGGLAQLALNGKIVDRLTLWETGTHAVRRSRGFPVGVIA